MAFRTIAFFLFTLIASGQSRQKVDSLNRIPFETKIAQASRLEGLFLENVESARKLKYEFGEARSYSNLALIYYYRGKYEQSIRYRLRAISLYENLNLTAPLADELGELGYSMKRRNLAKAQYYMQKGLKLAQRENLKRELLKLYDNYGVLKEMQGELDSALHFYRRGLDVKEQVKDSIGIPYSLSNIAGIYVMRRDFSRAIPLYDRALAIRKAKNDQLGIAENLIYFGDLNLARNDLDLAVGYYKQALEISRRHRYVFGIQTCHRKLAECYEKLLKPDLALDHFKKFAQYKDSIINRDTNNRIAELEVQFDTNQKEKELIEKQADLEQRNLLLLILGLASIFIAVTGFLIYRQQKLRNKQMVQEHKLKSAISQIETQNKLQEQRLTISRDLHDNIGAQLTFIISSVDNTRYAFDTDNTKLGSKLESIGQFARETIVELRDTIWAMNHSEITLEELGARISNFIEKAGESGAAAEFDFSLDPSLKDIKLTSSEGMNLYRTLQEAVNNAVKYASAAKIHTSIIRSGDMAIISVTDDGSGFDLQSVRAGNGLGNMQKRMDALGAEFAIESAGGKGTKITIKWALPQNQ